MLVQASGFIASAQINIFHNPVGPALIYFLDRGNINSVRRNHLVQRSIRSPINILFSSPTMSRRLYLGRMFTSLCLRIQGTDSCIVL